MDKMGILIQHLILSAPLCICLLAAVGHLAVGSSCRHSMANQQDVTYIPLEGCLQLPLDFNLTTTVTLRKKKTDSDQPVVAEWDRSSPGKETDYENMTYEGRTELDKKKKVIFIKNMTTEDNGVYYMVFGGQNPYVNPKLHRVEVIKNVTKPSVVYRPPCSPQSTTCSLVCEGNITDSGPVTYLWKKDEGEWMESGQNWTITIDEEWKRVEKVFCEMKNLFSVEQSDPCDNPFHIKATPTNTDEGNTPVGRIVGGIIIGVLILVCLVLGVKYRDHIKRRLSSCGSKPAADPEPVPLLPLQDPTPAENDLDSADAATADVSSLRNENGDHIQGMLPSCGSELDGAEGINDSTVENNHNSADGMSSSQPCGDVIELETSGMALTATPTNTDEVPLVPLQGEEEPTPVENNLDLADVMELIDTIMSRANSLYPLCEEVKANKTRCQRLDQRVKGLEELVEEMKQKGAGQNPAVVKEALCELNTTLQDAAEVVEKYTSDSFHKHLWKDYKHRDEFRSLNDHLNNTFQKLSLNVQVDPNLQTKLLNLFSRDAQRREDEKDRKEDHAELQKIMDLVDPILDKATSLSPLCEDAMRNKEWRQGLVEHVKGLKGCLEAIKEKGPGQKSADVEEALCEVKTTLESDEVAAFVEKYTSGWGPRDYGNDFDCLNKCLDNALKKLSSSLLYRNQNHKLFEEDSCLAEDEAHREEEDV